MKMQFTAAKHFTCKKFSLMVTTCDPTMLITFISQYFLMHHINTSKQLLHTKQTYIPHDHHVLLISKMALVLDFSNYT